jgi:hypothetical protein
LLRLGTTALVIKAAKMAGMSGPVGMTGCDITAERVQPASNIRVIS